MYSSVARLNKMSFDSACRMSTLSGVVLRNEGSYVAVVVEKGLSDFDKNYRFA